MTLLTCSAVRRRLPAFYDRELPVRELIAIETHVADCLPCTRELQGLQQVGDALRLAAAPGPADDWTGLQPVVISRMRAEAHESWPARAGRFFDDLHLLWIGLAATAATCICGAVALSALHFAAPERHDSLRAVISVMAAPIGSDLNPGRLETYIQVPSVPKRGPMEAMLARPVSEEELELALAAVVTREGRISGVSVLANDSDLEPEVQLILDGISRAKLEPARFQETPMAVNLVWLLTHTTVKAKAPRTT
jgi:putative zinc finger protein